MEWEAVLTRNRVIDGYVDHHPPTSEWYRAPISGIRFVDGFVIIETTGRYVRNRDGMSWDLLSGEVNYSFRASCFGTMEINGPRRIAVHGLSHPGGKLFIYPSGVVPPFPFSDNHQLIARAER